MKTVLRMMVLNQHVKQGLGVVKYLLRSIGGNFEDVTNSVNYWCGCFQYMFRGLLTRKRQRNQGLTEVRQQRTCL